MNLTTTQKTQILNKVEEYIQTRFFNPLADLPAWSETWREARGSIESSAMAAEFEERINQALKALRSSHVAFFHASGQHVPAPYALNATFLRADGTDPALVF